MTPNDIATTVTIPVDTGAVNATISQTCGGSDWQDFM